MMFDVHDSKGFSLIELMVVIAIIAVLSAVAVPSYTKYTRNAKLSAAINHGFALVEKMKIASDAGLTAIPGFPDTSLVAQPDLSYVDYIGINFVPQPSGDSTSGFVDVVLSAEADVPGFVAADSSNSCSGENSLIVIAYYTDANGTYKTFCGKPMELSCFVPVEYLPPGCQDEGFSTLIIP